MAVDKNSWGVKMTPTRIAALILAFAMIPLLGNILSGAEKKVPDKFDLGKHEYESKCAVCHGLAGKGDGPYVGLVDAKIADLSTLARRNNGVFPFQRVQEVIDGRQTFKSHGPREMPIWGLDYLAKGAQSYKDVPYDPEVFVRTRILALTEYIYRLQAK
jgi:mono/diheme cytochrome c family protein